MAIPRHEQEVDTNRQVWDRKPLLRNAYASLYRHMDTAMDRTLPGANLEIGSGIASLRSSIGGVLMTDSFVRPWLDIALDAYRLPLRDASVANLIAVDVFHHVARPLALLQDAHRALVPGGRVIFLEPYISLLGWLVYGPLHDEPIAMHAPIDWSREPIGAGYYAAQANATRLFFGREHNRWSDRWSLVHAARFASFEYVLSGGFSRPAFYPRVAAPILRTIDRVCSRLPVLFAVRCVVALQKR